MLQGHRFGLLSIAATLLALCAGCSTTPTYSRAPVFRESNAANLVLRFSSWECIFVAQPELRENGFVRIITRAELPGTVGSLQLERGLAVVVVPATCEGDALSSVAADWKTILSEIGFRRVVLLRSGLGEGIRGLEIIEDTAQNQFPSPGART